MFGSMLKRAVPSLALALALLAALTGVAAAQEMMTPSVTVEDQSLDGGTVTVAEVVSDGPGWIVIHADADGGPGPVLGYAAVEDGTNTDVTVEIDTASATDTLYAMLHTDAGEEGTYEFPGADGPVRVDGEAITPAFAVTGGMMDQTMEETMEEAMTTPSVTVDDQSIEDGTVTVAEVVSDGPGWIVIHADADGSPGPVLGHAAVEDGTNTDVMVDIDTADATSTLYAMLHTDAGTEGTYEFPGDDGPVRVDERVVTPSFMVTGGLPTELPETGGATLMWLALGIFVLGAGVAGASLIARRATTKA